MRVTPLFQRVGLAGILLCSSLELSAADGNSLTYLDESDPFHVGLDFPKLTTPQWVGEDDVEAVVIIAIDDMRQSEPFENFLRPVITRLQQIDGRAPVSIMSNELDPSDPHFQTWLGEGLSIDVHTLSHPCPLLQEHNFEAAQADYHGSIDLLAQIDGNTPVAYRMPCCDSINSTSPRFFSEIFNTPTGDGRYLSIDSSVAQIFTPADPQLPDSLTVDPDGREKFRKYLPFPSFKTTIENYPYPYVIGDTGWELSCTVPSDWVAQNLHESNNPQTVEDWKAALDATVLKQGVFTMVIHQWGWITPEQIVELIDYAESTYGSRVKFLNFPETLARLEQNVGSGQSLRAVDGGPNGVRLIDLNRDGFLDVVSGTTARTFSSRVWNEANRGWDAVPIPHDLNIGVTAEGGRAAEVRFGLLGSAEQVVFMGTTEQQQIAWKFVEGEWLDAPDLWAGLESSVSAIRTSRNGRDQGWRFRDLDGDGKTELIVSNPGQNKIWRWQEETRQWVELGYALPEGISLVDEVGRDAGLRFVDLNEDGFDDIVYSSALNYAVHLFVPDNFLRFKMGWSRELMSGRAGDAGSIPMIVREGENPDNGAWFHSGHMWVQNEDTAHLPDLVDRRSFRELMVGYQSGALEPAEALRTFSLREGFGIEVVAAEPEVMDPVAFEWGAGGELWVVQMQDYPLGMDGEGAPGGVVKRLTDQDGDGRYETATQFLEGLSFPTGVTPWKDGVLISAAPDLIYAEDTDGDGKADFQEVLFQGFVEGNQQHRFNGFEYGLDNWIYGANGDSGGVVRWNGADAEDVDIRGSDFRFRPSTGEFEAVEGQTQFGRRRDDWDNWFGNNNPAWGWHYVVPSRYLARNPFLPVATTKRALAQYEEGTRVYQTSPLLQRFNDPHMVDYVTSANSPSPYRDDWFGPGFESNVFISESVYNVVHREVLRPDGASFNSRRAVGEEQREFVASTDPWFRPTTLKTGPDGALYIADMYRFVIEHPEWIPEDTQKNLDLRAGSDRGRIYRVFPIGKESRPVPKLNQLDPVELVRAMESSNGWVRDTVQRLTVERSDPAAVPELERLVAQSSRPQVRLQALATLEGLGTLGAIPLKSDALQNAMTDSDSRVRRGAVKIWETWPYADQPSVAAGWRGRFETLSTDPSEAVRFQLAFTLGEWADPTAASLLVVMAERDWEQNDIRLALLSSMPRHREALLARAPELFQPFATELLTYIEKAAKQHGDRMAVSRFSPRNQPRDDYAEISAPYANISTFKGDVMVGEALYAPLCGQCHEFRGRGKQVGPSLDTLGDVSTEFLLQALLDPNASLEEKYSEVIVTKRDGTGLTGVLSEETETTATLRIMGGQELVLLKADLTRMEITGRSLMPEGLATGYDAQAMADLLAYLRAKPGQN